MPRVIEIRTYELKPGTRDHFHGLVVERSMPMLKRWNVDVVAYGPSLHDDRSYYLIRAYGSLADREQSQNAFYGSAEWREGPRDAILALIESHHSVVLEADDAMIERLRQESG